MSATRPHKRNPCGHQSLVIALATRTALGRGKTKHFRARVYTVCQNDYSSSEMRENGSPTRDDSTCLETLTTGYLPRLVSCTILSEDHALMHVQVKLTSTLG